MGHKGGIFVKKRILTGMILLLVVTLIFLTARWCFGNTAFAQRQIGKSEQFSREEIQDAMDMVENTFARKFSGCTLLQLTYDETYSEKYAPEWAENYEAQEALVLLSSFTTGPSSVAGGFNPNDLYTRWQWILTRSDGRVWELRTWGYG